MVLAFDAGHSRVIDVLPQPPAPESYAPRLSRAVAPVGDYGLMFLVHVGPLGCVEVYKRRPLMYG